MAGDFTQESEPFALFETWMAEAGRTSRTIPTPWRSPPSTRTACPTCAWCCSRASDARAASSSTPTSKAPRAASCWPSRKAALCFHWKSLRRQVRIRGPVEPVERGRGRRLFRHAPARQPHRRLGIAAVAAAGEPLRAGKGGRRATRRRYRRRRDAAPAVLVGLPRRAAARSSSGTTAVPPARRTCSAATRTACGRNQRLYP